MRAVWFKKLWDWLLIRLIKDVRPGAILLGFLVSSHSPPFVSDGDVNGSHLHCLLGNSWCKQTGSIPTLMLYHGTGQSCPSTGRRAEKSLCFYWGVSTFRTELTESLVCTEVLGSLRWFTDGRGRRLSLPSLEMLATLLPRLNKCSRANLFTKALMGSRELDSEVGSQICVLPLTDTQNSNKNTHVHYTSASCKGKCFSLASYSSATSSNG